MALLAAWAFSAHALSPGGFIKAIKLRNPKAVIEIGSLTAKELKLGSSAANVLDLLDLAQAENRLDPFRALQLAPKFQRTANGDRLLLKCLQWPSCSPESIIATAEKSALHAEVALRAPHLNDTLVNHEVGRITENMMTRYFTDVRWEQLEGQIGRTGIDGLFVFRKNGQIRDLLVVESKYKGSLLQETKFGTQMSKDWILKKLAQLLNHYPTNSDYAVLTEMVSNDNYRGLIWGLDAKSDHLLVSLRRTYSIDGVVRQVQLQPKESASFGAPELQRVNLIGKQTPFESTIARWYQEELSTVGQNAKPVE